jgi:hypothetical protein
MHRHLIDCFHRLLGAVSSVPWSYMASERCCQGASRLKSSEPSFQGSLASAPCPPLRTGTNHAPRMQHPALGGMLDVAAPCLIMAYGHALDALVQTVHELSIT